MKFSKHNLVLIGVLVLAFVLMLFRLESKSFWGDEIFSVTHAQRDLFFILSGEGEPGNPPLYFLLLHFWLVLGQNEFMVRLLSVFFGVLSVYMTYRVGELFFGWREGLVSAFLLSIAHGFIMQAQDARMYALVTFLSLCSLYFFYKTLNEGRNTSLFLYAFSTFLALCTHYFAFFVVFTEFFFFVLKRGSYSLSFKRFFSVLSVLFLLYLPLSIPFVGNAFGRVKWNIKEESIEQAADLWGYQPSTMVFATVADYCNSKYAIPFFLFPLLYGFYINWRGDRERYKLLFLWILLPVLVVFLLSFEMLLGFKYILFTLPVFLLLVSRGLTGVKDRRVFILLMLFIVLSAGVKLVSYYNSGKSDWRSSAAYVDAHAGTDLVVVQPYWARKYFWFYSGLDRGQIMGVTEEDGLPLKTIEVCSNNVTVWVVYSEENQIFDREGKVLEWLEENCLKKKEFCEINVYLCNP